MKYRVVVAYEVEADSQEQAERVWGVAAPGIDHYYATLLREVSVSQPTAVTSDGEQA